MQSTVLSWYFAKDKIKLGITIDTIDNKILLSKGDILAVNLWIEEVSSNFGNMHIGIKIMPSYNLEKNVLYMHQTKRVSL